MIDLERQAIVVGIDGSKSSLHAAKWAADIAESRKSPTILVHCLAEATYAAHDDKSMIEALLAEYGRHPAVRMLSKTAADLRRHHHRSQIDTRLLPGFPAPTLGAMSASASLLVVGAERSADGRMLIGSTIRRIANEAICPVAVWCGTPNHHGSQSLPIVVGVDGRHAGESAVAHAFEFAALRRAPLVAVHAWEPREVPYLSRNGDCASFQSEEALLAECLAGWSEKYPEVVVTRIVREGNAGAVLLEHARHAQLVVLGSHCHNKLTGTVLGSTNQRLLHNSPCPVLICRVDDQSPST